MSQEYLITITHDCCVPPNWNIINDALSFKLNNNKYEIIHNCRGCNNVNIICSGGKIHISFDHDCCSPPNWNQYEETIEIDKDCFVSSYNF